MKTQFVRNQKIIETSFNFDGEFKGTFTFTEAYFLDENEELVLIFVGEDNTELPEEIKALDLTCMDIINWSWSCNDRVIEQQEIIAKYNEQIVLLYNRKGNLFTYLGHQVELNAFETYSPRTYDSENLSYGVWNEEMRAFQFIDEWNGCKTLSFEEANQMAGKLNGKNDPFKAYESFGLGTIDEYISDCISDTLQPIEKELPYLIAADKSTINILENRIKADQEHLSLSQARLKALEIKQATINK